MALVEFGQAKAHLSITTSTEDADIQLKLDQAESIILDYLKNPTTAIASISAANPAVVTTVIAHGLISGVTYTLFGTTTTPTVEGARVVTVTSPTTFTVPVNVTIGQGSEAGIVSTASYTEFTAPRNITAAILLMLTHLFEHRGDDMDADASLWEAIDRLLKRHRHPALA